VEGGGVQLGPLDTAATNSPIVPAPCDYDGEVDGIVIGKENRSTRRKPAPVPLSSPQTQHAARTRTRAAALASDKAVSYFVGQIFGNSCIAFAPKCMAKFPFQKPLLWKEGSPYFGFLNNKYDNSNDEVKENEMDRACSTNGEKRNAYRIFFGNPEWKRPLDRPRHRWLDNIKMDLRAIEWDGMDWIYLAQDSDQWTALVNTVINIRVP
jgi:hypothetical protein